MHVRRHLHNPAVSNSARPGVAAQAQGRHHASPQQPNVYPFRTEQDRRQRQVRCEPATDGHNPTPMGFFSGRGAAGAENYGGLLAQRDSASPADREGSSLGLWWWGGGAVLRKAYRQSTSLVESCAVLRARAGATACSCSWRPPSLLSRTVSHAQSVHCMKRGTVGSGQPQSSQQW